MQFLANDEARFLQKKLDRQIADKPKPKLVLYYESAKRDYCEAANLITASIGEFTEVTLLFLFCATGDGWSEGNARGERWRRYRLWRDAHGDQSRLYDAPGHRFERGEKDDLSKVIAFALHLGWDALLAATPGRKLLFLSHDDRMEIYRGFDAAPACREVDLAGILASRNTRKQDQRSYFDLTPRAVHWKHSECP